jgi:predicted RNA-binding Zn-ribbon protein involved in translation (DUF1610 family)
MEDQWTYKASCEVCETKMVLIIEHEDEQPMFCPMCGEEALITE